MVGSVALAAPPAHGSPPAYLRPHRQLYEIAFIPSIGSAQWGVRHLARVAREGAGGWRENL